MSTLLLLVAALVGAFVVHAFRSIDVAYWQRKAMLLAIVDMNDPSEAIRKLEILRGIDWGAHVRLVTTCRDPWALYKALPAEVVRVR